MLASYDVIELKRKTAKLEQLVAEQSRQINHLMRLTDRLRNQVANQAASLGSVVNTLSVERK